MQLSLDLAMLWGLCSSFFSVPLEILPNLIGYKKASFLSATRGQNPSRRPVTALLLFIKYLLLGVKVACKNVLSQAVEYLTSFWEEERYAIYTLQDPFRVAAMQTVPLPLSSHLMALPGHFR